MTRWKKVLIGFLIFLVLLFAGLAFFDWHNAGITSGAEGRFALGAGAIH